MSIILGNYLDDYARTKPKFINDFENTVLQISHILRQLNINVIRVHKKHIDNIPFTQKVIWTRDVFVNINNKLQLLRTNKIKTRMNEYKVLEKQFTRRVTLNTFPDENAELEGGDIIEYKNFVFCGVGIRTNNRGVQELEKRIQSGKMIIKIHHTALHLDCCFCVLPLHNTIVYSSQYIKIIPAVVRKYFNIVCLESDIIKDNRINCNLASNFLYIYPNHIIISYKMKFVKFYEYLKSKQYKLHYVHTQNIERVKGSIRCLTQWYTRVSKQILY